MEAGDADAMNELGCKYYGEAIDGNRGLEQDQEKAVELWLRAGELGNAEAYHYVGNAYYNGNGVENDTKKAKHYGACSYWRGCVGKEQSWQIGMECRQH